MPEPASPATSASPAPTATPPIVGTTGPVPGSAEPSSGPGTAVGPDRDRLKRYLWVLLTGILGYLFVSAVLLSAYVLTEGRGFMVPMKWPSLGFVQLFAGPTFLAAFVPFVGVHMIASAMRWRVTPRAAGLAGALLGGLAAWQLCGRQGCFGPFGAFPLLGWYIVACCLFSALWYQLNARKYGF